MAELKSLTLNGVTYDSFPGSVDPALSAEGVAADAKAVGDALTALEGKIPTVPSKVSALENDAGYATEGWVQAGYQPKGEYLTEVPEGYAKTEDIPTKPSDIGAQPAGDYATKAEIPSVPSKVSAFTNDAGYATEGWVREGYQPKGEYLEIDDMSAAVNIALTQAKESGEFDGETPEIIFHAIEGGYHVTIFDRGGTAEYEIMHGAPGQRGTGLLPVTTAPSGYTTAVGGITPKYRMALSTIKTQAGVTEVLLGDTVRYSYYHYPIDYLDASYAYFENRVSIRGAAGAAGEKGDPGEDYVLTAGDKADIAALVIETLGGSPIFGVVDSSNNIVVSGDLPDGTYSVKYEMENGSKVNIGNLMIDTNVYYTVTNTLTQCTNSNSATKVVQGGSYSATITAKSGYELKSVTATMGGTAVSVSNGKINIASVTGNIVITAVAEKKQAAEPVTTNITLTDKVRIGSDGTDRAQAGYCATPHIDLTNIPKPCTIHLTKAFWCDPNKSSGMVRVHATKTDGSALLNDITSESVGSGYFTVVDNSGGIGNDVTVTVTSATVATIRFSGWWAKSGVADSDVTFAAAGTKATLTYTPAS